VKEKEYLKNIKELIESDIVLVKKNRIYEENHRLNTYFNIGKLIVECQGKERRAKYGNELIKKWSKELTELYGKGYDASNLKRMRSLYLTFQKGGPVGHLSWSHYRYILPIKEESKRNYYINLCIKQNLTKRKLIEKIKNNEYERLEYKDEIEIITDNSELTIKDMIKDPILIKTNKNIDKLSEKALKEFILDKIEEFLLELGVGFLFAGSEVKLGKHRCDLLFFNYELNSFIVIELKIRKLRHTDIGQISYYMNYINKNLKKDYMNDTIGLIICKENNMLVLKYTSDDRIYSSTYKLY
jgi:predicted nuclease of restriction endonuclease-like (RecB) superfamily